MNRMRIHSVDKSGRGVQVEGTRGGHALGAENGHGELLAKPTVRTGWEKICWCINVNHRHSRTVERGQGSIYTSLDERLVPSSWNDTRFHLLMGLEGQSDMVTDGGPIG